MCSITQRDLAAPCPLADAAARPECPETFPSATPAATASFASARASRASGAGLRAQRASRASSRSVSCAAGLNIDLKGKRAFIAGVADDQGFGWAIAKVTAHGLRAGPEPAVHRGPPRVGAACARRANLPQPPRTIGRPGLRRHPDSTLRFAGHGGGGRGGDPGRVGARAEHL